MGSKQAYCPFCGQTVDEGTRSCPFCGAPLSAGDDAPAPSHAAPVGSHAASVRTAGADHTAAAGVASVVDAAATPAAKKPGHRFAKAPAPDAEPAAQASAGEDVLFSLDNLDGDTGVNPNASAGKGAAVPRVTPHLDNARAAVRKPLAKKIAIAVAAVLVVAVAVGVGLAWKGDQDLKREAQQVSAQKKKSESKLDLMGGDRKIKAQAKEGLGGGDMVCDGSYLYWSDGSHILARKASGTKAVDATVLTKATAKYLNVCDGDLYYADGANVMKIEDIAECAKQAGGKGKSKVKVKTVATLEGDVAGLVVRDGTAAAMTLKDGKACVWRLDDDAAHLVAAQPASNAWLFGDDAHCDLVVAADTGWTVCEATLGDVSSAGEIVLEQEDAEAEAEHPQETHGPFGSYVAGSEQLKNAFFSEGTLYAVLTGSDGHTTLSRCTQGGTFSSFDSYADAGCLWANSHGCALVRSGGELGWIDASSGLSSDYDKVADKAGVDLNPSTSALWLNGTTLFVADNSGKSSTLWALDTMADAPKLVKIAR
mgnify:FL=1